MDSRLQNIGQVDIHGFQFDSSSGFDPNYSGPVYDHGLNTTQAVHPHAQAHFVQDGPVYFDANLQQQAQQPQQTQRQQRRTNLTQKNQLSGRPQNLNANSNANIDPTLNGTAVSNNANRGGVAHQRRTRLSQQPSRDNQHVQTQQVQQHAQYANAFNFSNLPQSTPLRQSPVATRTNAAGPVVTPGAGARSTHHNASASKNKPYTRQPQGLQTPAAASMDGSGGPNTGPSSTPNTVNTPLADQLTAFNAPSTFDFVPNPPNLQEWRERFFNITEPILLSSEQYHTYFPHVDNIYSHRSTQKYKKKPFVSHYWDCRLKGRPTGQPMPKLKKAAAAAAKGKAGGALDEDDDNADGGQDDGKAGGDAADDDQDQSPDKKKRKRKVRERDLCDVKIKVTEFFGRDELEALGRLGLSEDDKLDSTGTADLAGLVGASGSSMNRPLAGGGPGLTNGHNIGQLTFVLEDGTTTITSNSGMPGAGGSGMNGNGLNADTNMPFGVLEPLKRFPEGHPGAEGKRWYMVQRVNGSGKDGETIEGVDLDHKHTLEESDRIKKNSVQRWLLTQEKEKKKQAQRAKNPTSSTQSDHSPAVRTMPGPPAASWFASGNARATVKAHSSPASTGIVLYGSAFCPFAQRVWIALELKGIPYQFIELTSNNVKDGKCTSPNLLEVNPNGHVPALRHGNWAVWESHVMMEYLEDLSIGHTLLPLGNPQLRAHCRLWADHIQRKVLPYFYALLLLPTLGADDELAVQNVLHDSSGVNVHTRTELVNLLQSAITDLVNASHASGPYFLGTDISFVDVLFAPWIIRLSRVLSYYRDFPRPEVGTRWSSWVTAIEANDYVTRTVSDERGYHYVYGIYEAGGREVNGALEPPKCVEWAFARKVLRVLGFGFGDDTASTMRNSNTRAEVTR